MNPELLERFDRYMFAREERFPVAEQPPLQALTISREAGAGSITVARLVADIMEKRDGQEGSRPWAIFERNLVAKVLKDHLLPDSIERYLPEEAANRMSDFSEEFFGLHPSRWTLLQKTNQTILKLCARGNVILIGRGAHLVTANLRHVLHVRLVAPLEFRVRHIEEYCQLGRKAAAAYVAKEDKAKRGYLTRNFDSKPHAVLHFHLIVNTGRLGFPASARLISDAILEMNSREEIVGAA